MKPFWKLFGLLLLTGTVALSSCDGESEPEPKADETKKFSVSEWMPVTGKALSEYYADLFLENGAADTAEKKILIGQTDDPCSAAAMEEGAAAFPGNKKWYYVSASEDRIVLTGGDDEGIAAAVRYFLREYVFGEAKELPAEKICTSYEKYVPGAADGYRGTFVYAVDLSAAPFFADPTGRIDISLLLKDAISVVDGLGGGTVYLPAGHYKINTVFEIPSNVTLRGDRAEDPEKGTVLLVTDTKSVRTKNLFTLNAASALEGITVFYAGQDLNKPTEYPATVLCQAHDTWTVRGCYFVNSWDCIDSGTKPEGMITLDDVRGCALHTALRFDQHADICVFTDLYFSPTYWSGAGATFGSPSEDAIRKVMTEAKSVGMYVGDCDRDTYERILLDGFTTGIYNREMTRAGFSGSFYDLRIKNAKVGMELYGLDTRYGLQIANGEISAETPVLNKTDGKNAATPQEWPFLWLMNVETSSGTGEQTKILTPEFVGASTYRAPASYPFPTVRNQVYNVMDHGAASDGKADISAALQSTIDTAAKDGGGVVYLPAGVYRLEKPVTVPSDVLIAGCSMNPVKSSDDFRGTVILCTYGKDMTEDDPAAITFRGSNAGLNGITVFYPENGIKADLDPDQVHAKYAFFVRLNGKNLSVLNLCGVAVSRCVAADDCDGFLIDRLLMSVYDVGVRISSSVNGTVSRVHTNGTYQTLGANAKNYKKYLAADWMIDGAQVYHVIDNHIRPNLSLFKITDSEKILLDNCFHYGANHYMEAKNASLTLVNCEPARIFEKVFVMNGNVDLSGVNLISPTNNLLYFTGADNVFYYVNTDIANMGVNLLTHGVE